MDKMADIIERTESLSKDFADKCITTDDGSRVYLMFNMAKGLNITTFNGDYSVTRVSLSEDEAKLLQLYINNHFNSLEEGE